jgi:replicative DNA helicase
MFIYRDEYYLQQRMPKQIAFENDDKFHDAVAKWQTDMDAVHNKAEVGIAKQRHGPTGTVQLLFESEFTRFGDLDVVHGGDHHH